MPGDSKQTTTSNSEPWSGAQPALNKALTGAQNLYDAGVGGQVLTGSTVVPYSPNTEFGMNAISNAARSNANGAGLSGQYQDVIGRGGFNAAQQNALDNTRAVANSSFDINSDPAFQQVFNKTAEGVNLMASAAGRYGSPGAHQGTLARELGDLGARQYQNWQARKDAANQNLFGMGQQGFSNLGTAYTGMSAPAQDMMMLGTMDEDLSTRKMNDQLRIFNEQQNLPWEQVSRLNAIASGAGSLGGTTRQTQPGQNPWMTALGYGASGLGLLGGFL